MSGLIQMDEPGDWLALCGLWIFVPRDATAQHISDAAATLRRVAETRPTKANAPLARGAALFDGAAALLPGSD